MHTRILTYFHFVTLQELAWGICREYFARAVEGALQISVLSADRLTDHGVRFHALRTTHLLT